MKRLRQHGLHVVAPTGRAEPSSTAAAPAAAPPPPAALDQVLALPDGRQAGYDDYGGTGVPVLCCHGGPGNRRQRQEGRRDMLVTVAAARKMGLRLIGIDRPGYGLSSLEPGRTIASWAPTAIAVADHLGLARFMTMGISTGGSYSLCIAALYPERVIAVVTGCAMTDMRHSAAMASMPAVAIVGLAPSRKEAITLAELQFGTDGRGPPSGKPPEWAWGSHMPAADLAVLKGDMADPAAQEAKRKQSFANGVQGYVDDRRADAPGWFSFDVGLVSCPVTICHGEADTIVPVLAAHHTKALLPHAELRLFAPLGHLSIGGETLKAAAELAQAHG